MIISFVKENQDIIVARKADLREKALQNRSALSLYLQGTTH